MKKVKRIFNQEFHELSGCIHNHSQYSYDSDVSMEKIIAAAKKKKLDYITINDHRNFAAKDDKAVLKETELHVIIGAEMNDGQNNNHLLVFNSDTILKGKTAEEYARIYLESDAITFIAHPFEDRRTTEYRKYVWTNRGNVDFHGLEIWNAVSEWLGKLNPKKNGFFLVFFPYLFIKNPHDKAVQYWDELAVKGKHKAAIGSTDAHTIKYKWRGISLKFLTHAKLFKTIRTNILIKKESEINETNILQALKKGNSYLVNYRLGDPFQFYSGICDEDANGVIYGEEIKWKKNLRFYFRLPKIAKVTLVFNGKKIGSKRDEKGFFVIPAKGVYRLEITCFGRGWIYTNHVYVT